MFTNRELQKTNLYNLLKTGAFRFVDEQTPWFPYTSGQIGPYYVQSVDIEKNGDSYAQAIESLVQLIQAWQIEFDIISGGETRDWDFSNPCAAVLRKPHLKIYKDGRMLGAGVKGKRVLQIVDLNNEGSSVRDYWHPLITKEGGELSGVLSFVDRMEDGLTVMRQLNLPLASVIPLDAEAWKTALDYKYISAATHKTLLERLADPLDWALNQLRQNPEPLRKMLRNAQTLARGNKILAYYSQFKPELKALIYEN